MVYVLYITNFVTSRLPSCHLTCVHMYVGQSLFLVISSLEGMLVLAEAIECRSKIRVGWGGVVGVDVL